MNSNVLIVTKPGRLGNQLFLFGHFLANALEHGYSVWNLAFHDYGKDFKGTCDDMFCRFPSQVSCVRRCRLFQKGLLRCLNYQARACARLNWSQMIIPFKDISRTADRHGFMYELASEEFSRMVKRHKWLAVHGWLFRDFTSFDKHAETLRRFFMPVDPIMERVSQVIVEARRDFEILVGIHIRQGDYRCWQGGRYFFDSEVYAQVARNSMRLWPGRKVGFVICSDEVVARHSFKNVPVVLAPGTMIEDMYTLSQCDYIMGTQSTYSQWASFFGKVPRYVMEDPKYPFSLADFKIAMG